MTDKENITIPIQDFCSQTLDIRTKYVGIDNYTKWTVLYAEFRCIDESNNAPNGFSLDTGWFVGVQNTNGPAMTHQDICIATGRPIQATRVKCRYKLQWGNNPPNNQVDCPDLSDGDTTSYYDHAAWELKLSGTKDANGLPEARLYLVKQKHSK